MSLQLTCNLDWKVALLNSESISIPTDWAVQNFQEIGSFKTGKDHKAVTGFTYPVYGSSSTPMSMRAASPIFSKDSFIIGRKGTIDKPFFVKGPFWCVDTAMYFENDSTKADIRFLYYKAKTIPWLKYNSGSTIPSLTQSLANSLTMALPKIEEQTAIANILSDQEGLVAHYDNLVGLHEKRFAYLSDELLSGRLRFQENSHEQFSPIKNELWTQVVVNAITMDIPQNWTIVKLKSLCSNSITKGTTPSSIGHKFFDAGEIKYYKVEHLKNSQLLASEVYISDECQNALGRSQLREGDLLFSIAGTIGNLGLVTAEHLPGNVNQAIAIIRPKLHEQRLYLRYLIGQFIESMTANKLGNVIPNFNLEMLQNIDIVLPGEKEQNAIVNILSDQEALIAEYKKLRDAEKKRFDWLSDALLSGTYRVKMEA